MRDEIAPPTVEDAFTWLVRALRHDPEVEQLYSQDHGLSQYGYGLYLPNVMYAYASFLIPRVPGDQHAKHQLAMRSIGVLSKPFYSAAWELCRRGVLRPGVERHGTQATEGGNAGDGYSLTPFGEQWLADAWETGRYDFIPTELGRHAGFVASMAEKFGDGFKQRANEAMRCYQANAYFACCSMCGAAAESVLLSAAIARSQDEEDVVGNYQAKGGRGRIENFLLGQAPRDLQDEVRSCMVLLKYWRDASAHGIAREIAEAEAFTSLMLMMRLCHVVRDRWNTLTGDAPK